MNQTGKTPLLNLPIDLDNPKNHGGILQPAGLSVLSSFLKKEGCDVILYDAFAHCHEKEIILKRIEEISPSIIGITLFTSHIPQVRSFLREVRKRFPDILHVAGGPHPSSAYDSILNDMPEIDIAVIGEGEYVMLEIIDCVKKRASFKDILGIVYREGGKNIQTPFRGFITDLDSLPFSDWDSLPMEKYFEVWTIKKNYAHMILSRGCPFSCTFCGAKMALGMKQRRRSPQHVLEEIKVLYDKHGVRNILFGDSTFNLNKQWVHEICEGLLNLGRPILWNCNIRADLVDRETVAIMKKSGCMRVFIGVESADEEMLKRMQKGIKISKLERGIKYLQEYGINPDMGFIFGMPGETEETMKKSIEFAKKHKTCMSAFTLAAPFPGTPFYDEAKMDGLIVEDWSKFNIYEVAYTPKDITKKMLLDYYGKAVSEVYLSPIFLWQQLRQIRSLISLRIHIKFAWRVIYNRILAR